MIEIICVYSKESLTNSYKSNKKANKVLLFILSIVLFACGVANLITNYNELLEIFLSVLLLVASPMPIYMSNHTEKKYIEEMVKAFGVSEHDVQITFQFRKSDLVITFTEEGKSKTTTYGYDYIYMLKIQKNEMVIYLDKETGFLVNSKSFTKGDLKSLVLLLKQKQVLVK